MNAMRHCLPLLLALSTTPAAAAAPEQAVERGELLYSTHCITCHTGQAHWRDKKAAANWPALVAEVRRWQDVQKLGWNAADIDAVALHLNARFYRYPAPH